MTSGGGSRFRSALALLFGGSQQFRSNLVVLASSNAAGQLVSLLALPLLTRLFAPDEFGIFAIYVAAQSIILGFVTGRVEWLVPNAKTSRNVALLLGMGLFLIAGFTILLMAVLVIDSHRLARLIGLPAQHAKLLWLMPFTTVLGGVQLLLEAWHVYRQSLKPMGKAKFFQSVATVVFSTISGALAMGVKGLIIGYLLGYCLSCLVMLAQQKRLLLRLFSITRSAVRRGFVDYRSDIIRSIAVSLVNVCMAMSITLLIAYYYDSRTVGWYSLVFRVATGPVALFTSAIVYSFWSEAAALAKTSARDLRRFYVRSVARLALMSVPLAVLALLAPIYVGPIFGEEEWSGAGWLLTAMTPYLVGILIFGPTTHLIVYRRQDWQFWCDLATLCCVIAVFSLLASNGYSATQSVAAASIALLCGYLARFVLHLLANSALRREETTKVSE
jgi:O-antigen/teichoic acid export membrane protein